LICNLCCVVLLKNYTRLASMASGATRTLSPRQPVVAEAAGPRLIRKHLEPLGPVRVPSQVLAGVDAVALRAPSTLHIRGEVIQNIAPPPQHAPQGALVVAVTCGAVAHLLEARQNTAFSSRRATLRPRITNLDGLKRPLAYWETYTPDIAGSTARMMRRAWPRPATTRLPLSNYGASKKPNHCCTGRCPCRGAFSGNVINSRF